MRAIERSFPRQDRATPTSPPPARRSNSYAGDTPQAAEEPSMLKQIEGSHAVAEAIALCRPEVICAYPITPQTHIVEGLGELVNGRSAGRLRIHQCRKSEFAALSVAIGASAAGARAYTATAEPGPAVHGGGGLQRLRPRPADRDDARQPRDRRAHQYLERSFRRDVDARLPDGSSCSPRPTRRRSTCTSRRSGWPRNCRCRSWSASTASS